jgi:PAS domain S-box-containing protein
MPALRRTERGVLAGFAVALALVTATAIAGRISIARLEESGRWVDHTDMVLGRLEALSGSVLDIRDAVRGYILAGDPKFLTPYASAVPAVRQHLAELRAQISDNPLQLRRLDSLDLLVTRRITVAESLLALRRSAGFAPAQREWARGEGTELHQAIRALVGEMAGTERTLLARRRDSVSASVAAASAIVLAGGVLGFGAVVIAMFYIHRGFVGARRNAVALLEANEALDTRVRERTAELEATQARLSRIAAVSPAVLHSFRLGPDGSVSFPYASGTIVRLYGATPEELAADASAVLARFHPDDAPRVRASIAESAAGLSEWRDEWRYQHPERGEIWIAGYSSPVREPDGGTIWHGVLGDVTERRMADEALRESEKQFRTALNSIPQLAWIAHPDGYIFWYNDRWYEYTGTTPAEMEGWGWQSVHDPEALPAVMERWSSSIATGERFEMEFPLRGADGAFREFLTRGVPLRNQAGQVVRWFGTNTDITAQKLVEAELNRRAAELARSNTDLEQFAYVASHDLQEPLRAVGGCVQLLKRRYHDKLDPRADELIAHTVDGAARMQKLIDDLLAFSRVGTRHGQRQATDSGAILEGALANLGSLLRDTGARITHDPMPMVSAEPAQLLSLFQNLIGNAVKFLRETPPRVHVGAVRHATAWQFSVQDNGLGIEPQYFERIFGIFQRLHTRSEYPGTGMGLAMCKRIVEQMGGRIWVESALGSGSTFHFTIPDAA